MTESKDTEVTAEAPPAPPVDAATPPPTPPAPPAAATAAATVEPIVVEGPVDLPELLDDAALLRLVDEAIEAEGMRESEIYSGTVLAITDDAVTVDIGNDKTDDIPKDEFIGADGVFSVEVGQTYDVYVDRLDEDATRLSKEKADKLRFWEKIAEQADSHDIVQGTIIGRVKGGLSVDIGVKAFLPGSQVDLRPGRNLDKYIGQTHQFEVIKFNKKRGNIVLSRRALIEKERAGLKDETLATLRVGAVVKGIVKNLTDYGCFVDLGGIDGLLHVTDISWARINHPKQLVSAGDELELQVLRFDPETEKVSLGLKQLRPDPWEHVERKYQLGQRVEGRVVSMAEYGAFIEIEDGVEGMVHVSEMSWTKRVKHPKEIVKRGQEVEAVILGIDENARRISLGMKQTQANPWSLLQDRYPVGAKVTAKVRNVTNFGVFLGIEEGIDGLVHVSDLAWGGKVKDPRDHYNEGDELEAVVLNIDVDAERFSLGIKQLSQDPWGDVEHRFPIGHVVEGEVIRLLEFGAIVKIEDEIEGLVHISEISDERTEDINEALKVGQTVRAKVLSLVPDQRKMGLSIKRLIESEHAAEMADYDGSNAARTTIGDLIKEKIDIASLPPGPAADGESDS